MFFWGEIESEIRANNQHFLFNCNRDAEKYMKSIDSSRPSVYPHSPSADCIEKGDSIIIYFTTLIQWFSIAGCGKCYTVDGNWKLTFPHCMFPVKSKLQLAGINFADVCPSEPCGMQAFCEQHKSLAENRGYPTSVSGFSKYCRNQGIY